MAFTGRYVYNSLFGYHTTDATHDIIHTSDRYQPSVNDVFTVKEFLREECGFPLELIDVCIDYAQYWPHTSSVTPAYDYPKSVRSGIAHENEFLVSHHTS